ncbi:MAG: DUF3431 domain-containing protein, partial [Verrucomicrobiaceae bacterium]
MNTDHHHFADNGCRERLCVASYQEPGVMEWVRRSGIEACVYNADRSRLIWEEGMIELPNQAREASQYLHHIIRNYGEFRDHEIFLQGDPLPHNPVIMEQLALSPWRGKRFEALSFPFIPFNSNSFLPHSEHLIPFGLEIGVKEFKGWTMGAMFAVSRDAIEVFPLHWWQELLEKVIAEPWSPWVMEQLWMSI